MVQVLVMNLSRKPCENQQKMHHAELECGMIVSSFQSCQYTVLPQCMTLQYYIR